MRRSDSSSPFPDHPNTGAGTLIRREVKQATGTCNKRQVGIFIFLSLIIMKSLWQERNTRARLFSARHSKSKHQSGEAGTQVKAKIQCSPLFNETRGYGSSPCVPQVLAGISV